MYAQRTLNPKPRRSFHVSWHLQELQQDIYVGDSGKEHGDYHNKLENIYWGYTRTMEKNMETTI